MKRLLVLAAVLFATPALADKVSDALVFTGPNMEQLSIDTLLVTPTGGLQMRLRDALAFGANLAAPPPIGSGMPNTGAFTTLQADTYQQSGQTVLDTINSGSSTVVGIGAGAALPSNDTESLMVGYQACGVLTTRTAETTCLGWWTGHALQFGSGNTLVGDGALIFEVSASDDNCSGADTCRNIMGTQYNVAMGRRALAYGSPQFDIALGTNAVEGNSASIVVTGTATTGDTLTAVISQPSNALTASISGTTLTVTVAASNTLGAGEAITGAGVTAGMIILSNGTGTGGTGTYVLNKSQTVGSESMTAQGNPTFGNLPRTINYTVPAGSPTKAQMASGLANAITADSAMQADGIAASAYNNVVVLQYPGDGSAGYALNVAASVTGSTETLTAGQGALGHNITGIGYDAATCWACTSANNIIAIGNSSALGLTTAASWIFVGPSVATSIQSTGTFGVLMDPGGSSDTVSASSSNLIAIGRAVQPGTGDVQIGTFAGQNTTADSLFNTEVGYAACSAATSGGSLVCVGANAGGAITTGAQETFVGFDSGHGGSALTGNANSGFGAFSLFGISGAANSDTALGTAAGQTCSTCTFTTLVGANVGKTSVTTGSDIVLIGVSSACDTSSSNYFAVCGSTGAFLSATGIGTPSTSVLTAAGTFNAVAGYQANGVAGVSCAANTVSLATLVVTNGIITHC